MLRKGEREGGEEQGRRWMYKKQVLSACAAPLALPPEDGVMGWRWKRDFEEGVILPSLPRRRRRGIRAEAPDTARDVKIHTHTVLFTLCTWLLLEVLSKVTLKSSLFCIAHSSLKLTIWAIFFHTFSVLTVLNCSQKSSWLAAVWQLKAKIFW